MADTTMRTTLQARRFGDELARRLRCMWLAKTALMTGGIGVFFRLYFGVMSHPLGTPTAVPITALDAWWPASSLMLVPYCSLWVYLSLSLAMAASRREVLYFARSAGSMAIAGLAFYWLFPTFIAGDELSVEGHPTLEFLRQNDHMGNAFPSLHVAFSVFAYRLIDLQFGHMRIPSALRRLSLAWCLAIVLSTLSTRQHAVADVVGGLALCWIFWRLHLLSTSATRSHRSQHDSP